MSRLTRYRLRLYALLVTLSVLAGLINGWLVYDPAGPDPSSNMLLTGVNWLLGSMLYLGFELFFLRSRFGAPIRRMYFLTAIAVKAGVLIAVVILSSLLGQLIVHGQISFNFLIDPAFLQVVLIVFLVATLLLTITQIVRIIGARVLINFILGRYHRPVREQTLFMFLDLANSTALTRQLGDIGVQTMITRFFFDITEPIIEYGGEIHRYVGDQVVITWPLGTALQNQRAVQCYFAIRACIADRSDQYRSRFGTVPGFRAGLHGGPVVVSECGDKKQEISYFGDTVNTAARIEQQCKELDCPLLISAELLRHVELPEGYRAESRGIVRLKGREQDSELFTVTEV